MVVAVELALTPAALKLRVLIHVTIRAHRGRRWRHPHHRTAWGLPLVARFPTAMNTDAAHDAGTAVERAFYESAPVARLAACCTRVGLPTLLALAATAVAAILVSAEVSARQGRALRRRRFPL